MMKLFIKFFKHLVVMIILGYPAYQILHTLHFLNPLEKELADFRFTDIYFGHFQENVLDEDIYFIDVGLKDKNTTRTYVSDFINKVNKNSKPKVIALDITFDKDSEVSKEVDRDLQESLADSNIVLAYNLKQIKGQWLKDKTELLISSHSLYDGFSNNLTEKKEFGVERFFQPTVLNDLDTLKHFSVVASEKAGLNIDESLLKDNNKVMINFKYKYHDAISIEDTANYYKLKDKIVIVGLFTKNKNGFPLYNEDLHYTSSNKFYFGKSPPNMYGGEVLATIISNIKYDTFIKYYKSLSFWINIILSFLVYLSLLFFLQKSYNIFLAVSIITQFGLVTLFVFFSIFVVHKWDMYLDLTTLGVISFFSVEFVGVIEEILHLFEEKFKRKKIS